METVQIDEGGLVFIDVTASADIDGRRMYSRIEQFNRAAHVSLWFAGDDDTHDNCVTIETGDVWVEIGQVIAGNDQLDSMSRYVLRKTSAIFQMYGSDDYAALFNEWRETRRRAGQRQK